MKNKVHLVELGSIINIKIESIHNSQTILESSLMALDSCKSMVFLHFHRVLSMPTNIFTKLNAYDKVPKLKFIITIF